MSVKVFMLNLLGFGFLLISAASLAQPSVDTIDSARQTELMHLLKQDCGSCHGLKLKGGLGPPLLVENLTGKPASFLAYTILNGRPGTAMPPWKELLKPEEAEWLANVLLNGELK